MNQLALTLQDVQAAAARLAGHVLATPCLESRTLGQILGARVFLKFENLQFTASFKERGALNKLVRLLATGQPVKGVIAASAGNHAQGLAYHAQRLGLRAVIVMPELTPTVKVERTLGFGAEVLLHGQTFDEAHERAMEVAADQGLVFVHPFDDADVMAGQGTVALEMLQAQPDIDTLVVAVGGGGLLSGMATVARALRPGIRIVGVQSERLDFSALGEEAFVPGTATRSDAVFLLEEFSLGDATFSAGLRSERLDGERDVIGGDIVLAVGSGHDSFVLLPPSHDGDADTTRSRGPNGTSETDLRRLSGDHIDHLVPATPGADAVDAVTPGGDRVVHHRGGADGGAVDDGERRPAVRAVAGIDGVGADVRWAGAEAGMAGGPVASGNVESGGRG
jgi:cysteine synthase